jgi:mono/diheme cytochrome c family protein
MKSKNAPPPSCFDKLLAETARRKREETPMQSQMLRSPRGVSAVAGLIALCVFPARVTAQAQQKNADEVTAKTGAQVYKQARCYACHGEQGFGGVGPSFRQDHFLALSDYVIAQILLGRGIMPSFAETLSDEQIAAVASYIRTSWGNAFGDVKADEVAATRKELKEKMPQRPHVSASEPEQPREAPAPPSGGQPPGQPLPPANMR